MNQPTRKEKIELLRQYYLKNLVEDPMDGTDFDCLVLDMLDTLEARIPMMESSLAEGMTTEQLTTLFLKYKPIPIPVVPGFGWRAYADLEEHLQKPWVVKTIPMEDKEQKSSEENT